MSAKVERVTVKCAYCGKEFQRLACKNKGRSNLFCRRECMWKLNNVSRKVEKIQIKCANCGKTALKFPYEVIRTEKQFCSKKCVGEYSRKSVIFKCDWCGKDVVYPQSHLNRSEKHFCNSDCHAAWKSANLCGENNPLYSKVTVGCAVCGKEIEKKKSHAKKCQNNFCSKECKGIYYRSEENRNIQRKRMLKTLSTYPRRTKPEKVVSEILDDLGINYSEQYVINNRFCVDFLVDNLVIEVFGDYFHANPIKYGDGVDGLQKKNILNDNRKLKYLQKCGYQTLIIWEYDINNKIDEVKEIITDEVKEIIKEVCRVAV